LDFGSASAKNEAFAKARNAPAQEIQWPVSYQLVEECGFKDSFRQANPDPMKNFGLTWSPGYPKGVLKDDEVHDRIDFIYHRGNPKFTMRCIESYTIDEAPAPRLYPSDHRAVVSRIAFEEVVNGGAAPSTNKIAYPFVLLW